MLGPARQAANLSRRASSAIMSGSSRCTWPPFVYTAFTAGRTTRSTNIVRGFSCCTSCCCQKATCQNVRGSSCCTPYCTTCEQLVSMVISVRRAGLLLLHVVSDVFRCQPSVSTCSEHGERRCGSRGMPLRLLASCLCDCCHQEVDMRRRIAPCHPTATGCKKQLS